MFKRMIQIIILGLALLTISPAHAQAPSVTATWGASITAGVAYNVYRAPCTGPVATPCSAVGTLVKISPAAGVAALTYTDTTVASGSSYSYNVTAFCAVATTCSESGPITGTVSVL